MWEVWLETVNTFEDLRKSLYNRGYRELPTYSKPLIYKPYDGEIKSTKNQEVKKSMLRKKRN
jgi:hypothetical protein